MQCPVELAVADRVVSGQAATVNVGSSDIALFNLGGHFYALDDTCLRCGASLAAGVIDGTCVTCSSCHWQYYIPAGSVVGMPSLRLDTFAVHMIDAQLVVETTPLVSK